MTTPVSSAQDDIEIESLPPGWRTAKVTFQTKTGAKVSVQIIDCTVDPPMQYRHDTMRVIAQKCAGLVFGIPFFAILCMAFRCVRMVTLVVGTFAHSVYFVWQERSWASLKNLCVCWTVDVAEILLRGSADVIKVPFLSFAMQLCCLYGIAHPLHGRVLAARVEHWMRGAGRANDLRHFDCKPAITDLMTNKDSPYCFHWAFCFQPIAPALIGDKVLKIEYLPENIVISKKGLGDG